MGDVGVYPPKFQRRRANSEILCQHNGPADTQDVNFYLHDRLGSTRQVINKAGSVVRYYSFDPFGELLTAENAETTENHFKFTGQYFDYEIRQYYLRARQYDPILMRMTSSDLAPGSNEEPLSLHKYLYCQNDPINGIDPSGESYVNIGYGLVEAAGVYFSGLTIATIGAENNNFELIEIGSYVQQFTPLAFVWGSRGGPIADKFVQISHWGDPIKTGSWVVKGGPSFANYLRTFKWIPGKGFAWPYADAHTMRTLNSALKQNFKGPLAFFDYLFGYYRYHP